MPDLIRIDRAAAARPEGGDGLRDLSWRYRDGETWAVTGPVGSGKSTFAELLLGRLVVRAGTVAWPLVGRLGAAIPSDVVRLVSFRERSRLFSYRDHYYQERFNFSDPLSEVAVRTFLGTGLADPAAVPEVARRFGIDGLLDASLITLSNGQVRRARLARAVLARPGLLILDDPFLGLDAAGREGISRLLGELVEHGTRVLVVGPPDLVPDWVTHVLELDAMAVRWQGPVESWDRGRPARPPAPQFNPPPDPAPGLDPLIELRNVTVRYGPRTVLDGIDWTVRPGERWAVLGPNGSGKTTLLSLVCGDHPQAYANDVRVFGRRRGSGESIWDVKRRLGLVSPELHQYFSEPLTAGRAAATGFTDTMAARPTTPDQDATVRRLFAEFGLADVAARPFARLSTGQQRLVLLVRALVKDPELLILDEPFQGLDRPAIEHAREWLDARLRPDQTLVMVTHHPEELPRSVTRVLRLQEGRSIR